jgi:phosphatidylglycerol---prolipoprotein diacylglyceryl transferase
MYPVLYRLGPVQLPFWDEPVIIPLYSYGVLSLLAFVAGFLVYQALARRHLRQSLRVSADIALVIVFAALAGGKLFSLLGNLFEARSAPVEFWRELAGGMVYYGGLLTALAVGTAVLRWWGVSWRRQGDMLAPGLALGHALGRVGCFLAGCCWGRSCELPWAVTFTAWESFEHLGTPLHRPVHPTQLYEATVEFLLFLLLLYLLPRRRFDGQVLLAYVMLYAPARFVIEFFRADPRPMFFQGVLSISQVISLILMASGLAVLYWRRRKGRTLSPSAAGGGA